MNWIPLKMLNGWIAVPNDPPRFAVFTDGIAITGQAVPTRSKSLPCARLPKELRPPEVMEDEFLLGAHIIMSWRIKPNGYLYIKQRHILEF